MKDEGDLGGTVRAIAGRGRQGGDGSVVRVPVKISDYRTYTSNNSAFGRYEYRYGLSPDGAADMTNNGTVATYGIRYVRLSPDGRTDDCFRTDN